MNFHIIKHDEMTVHEQLREQIIFHISTGELAIGQQMPGVRSLARRLEISSNTVSGVYSELVRGGWLVERAGTHHMVVERKSSTDLVAPGTDLDDLIDVVIKLAVTRGHSLQQLADRLRHRLLDQPADHFLIVEPDPGMGIIMREEIRKTIGYEPPTCGLYRLLDNPAIAIGALLITPTYIVGKLGQYASDSRRVLPVSYSPIAPLTLAISSLSRPSLLGWVSVSGAGLKTMSGMAAPMSGNLHSSHLFLAEQLDSARDDKVRLRRYWLGEYRPVDILKSNKGNSVPSFSTRDSGFGHDDLEVVTAADLHCMDLVFCDSVAMALIDHPHKVHYQLLSDDSLDRIKAEAHTIPRSESNKCAEM
jgi:DNA-binding transcriptional regulator YhcF (GntR family)